MFVSQASRDEQSLSESAEGLRGKIQRRTSSQAGVKLPSDWRDGQVGRSKKASQEVASRNRDQWRGDPKLTLATYLVALLFCLLFWGTLMAWFIRTVAAASLG